MMNLPSTYHGVTDADKLMRAVDRTADAIKTWLADHPQHKITHMLVSGISGQSVGWPVSYKLGLPVCVVRKPGEDSHGKFDGDLVGNGNFGDYVIVDDQIATGSTINRMLGQVAKYVIHYGHEAPRCRAIFLFRYPRTHPFEPTQYGKYPPLNLAPIPVIGEQSTGE